MQPLLKFLRPLSFAFARHDPHDVMSLLLLFLHLSSSMRLWNQLPPDFHVLNSLTHFQRVFEGHTLTSLLIKRQMLLLLLFIHDTAQTQLL